MSKLAALIAITFASFGTHAQEGASVEMGSTEAVINHFIAQNSNPQSALVRSLGGVNLGANIRDYFYKNGVLSVTGTAIDSKNSVFVLKGSKQKLYGYLVLHDSKKAFEYTTNSKGIVSVKEVPISKIYPDLDERFPMQTQAFANIAVSHPKYSPMALRQAPHIGPYQNEDVTKLESKPGSPYVFYLNTAAVMSGSTPLNGVTKEQMYRTWQSVADQYSMLNMNVTTNLAVYNAAKANNLLRTGVLNYVNQDGRSNAPLHSFGTTAAGTLYRNSSAGFDYGYGIGMTAAHEVGHQMGMLHDHGGSGGEYFEGIPAFQWGPIMGNYWMGGSWANQLFTWSKGEYNTASNFEDDLNIMNAEESVPYAVDDNQNGKALLIEANGDINPQRNFGQIERNTDSDSFMFSLNSVGTLNASIDPIEYLRMLDIEALVYDSANKIVARSNLSVNRSAEFNNQTLAAGHYRLVIKGGAEGTPQHGFSNYSSLGYYAIKGALLGKVVDTDPVLKSGVPLTGQLGTTGGWKHYVIDVPAGMAKLQFSIAGGNGDADLYAQLGARATSTSNICKSDGSTSNETCSVNQPAAGKYYLSIYGYAAYSALSVSASFSK
ncbi:pre-peptidase C-terminal domain-containing protein [Iodobacter arcticus]|uniref:Pre-peptidase C-terminal domain-containing protein n=1 Tax=Iodobacter arcticus TaxID=590593 RepID=A0ABW2QYA0_9NEIS